MPILVERERRWSLKPLIVASGTDLEGRHFTEITHAIDVSGSGLCFASGHNMPVGTRLTMKVFIPKALRRRLHNRRSFAVLGLVSRVEKVAKARGHYRVGVRMLQELDAAAPSPA